MYHSPHLYLLADGGVQVFLLGRRVFYCNVAPSANEVSFALAEVPSAEQWVRRHSMLDPTSLEPGRNLLAVSHHQSSPTNADLAFDLQLTAGLHGGRPQLFVRFLAHRMELSWPAAFHGWQSEATSALELEAWRPVNQLGLREGAWHSV